MFYKKYLDDFYYEELLNNYSIEYLQSINEENFAKVYDFLKKHNFYFIEDVIEQYLEIFEYDLERLEKGIIKLREEFGENYIYIIGDDLSLLNRV